jgi:hypothetical protein
MTMLTHTGGSFRPARLSQNRQDAGGVVTTSANLAMIKRFCIGAVTVVAAVGALAAIVALKAALFVSVFHYY